MKINKTGITFTALKEMTMYIIIIDTVYEADQEKMHEFVTPLSPNFSNKCITIGMYFSATTKATTDKTLRVGKELTWVMRDCLWESYHTKE